MLTVAEETLQQLAARHGKQVATHLYGQDINAETYAICKADLLLKGEGEAADNIVGAATAGRSGASSAGRFSHSVCRGRRSAAGPRRLVRRERSRERGLLAEIVGGR